jgi:hypothetical protein
MSIKTLKDIETKKQNFIDAAKADSNLIETPVLKDNRILKGFKIPEKMAQDLKILSAKTRKDQSQLVIEAIELLFSKYFGK